MTRLTLVLALVALAIIVLTLTEVEGRSRGKPWHEKGHGRGKHRGLHPGKGRAMRMRQRDQAGRRAHDRHRQRDTHRSRPPWRDLFSTYHEMDPLSFFSFRWNMEATMDDPWWEGPNVCEREEEEIVNNTETKHEMMRHFSTNSQICDESETAYKCKMVQENIDGRRELTVVYECCHGYSRRKGDFGCPHRISMKNLLEKADELGLTDFVKAVKTLRMTRELETGNYTVFIPENGAFTLDSDLIDSGTGIILKDEPSVIAVSEPAVDKALQGLENAILGHMVMGFHRTSSMEDEELLETGNPDGGTIRINYFTRPEKLMTANCVPVVSRDHMATNGVIHTVKKALKPVTQSLLDIVRSRPELSTLKTVLASANYVSTLDKDGQLTLLAPTNSAFERMNPRLRERLLNGDRKCLENVLQNHLLPNVICSTAIQGEARTINQLHHYLNVSRTEDDKVFVGGSQVVQADVMATNGAMHVIDDVLVPDEALSFLDILEKEGYTEFLSLVEKAALTKTLEELDNVTVFAPTNEAIQSLPTAVRTKLNQDGEMLRNVLNYHVSPNERECHRLQDNQLLTSLAGKDIRINKVFMFPFHHGVTTAQCVPIEQMNLEACNGHVNIIKDVMMPPVGNVVDVLALDKEFSTLVSLVKKAGIADSLQAEGPFTVFAPNNKAFEDMDDEELDALTKDPERLEELLKRHVIEDTLCCAGIIRSHRHRLVTAMSGDHLRLSRDRDNSPKVGHATVITCDQTATNGNVLEIDRVLVHEPSRSHWRFNPFARWHELFRSHPFFGHL